MVDEAETVTRQASFAMGRAETRTAMPKSVSMNIIVSCYCLYNSIRVSISAYLHWAASLSK